jgi:hypothetical protein
MDDRNSYGNFNESTSQITLTSIDGMLDISKDKILDTFYHEKVHSILVSMGEKELNKNEQFVDVFAKLLRQSDETAEFNK